MSEESPKVSADPKAQPTPAEPPGPPEPPEDVDLPLDEPPEPKKPRSSEFWVAVVSSAIAAVGVAATATVGIWAAQLAYKASTNQAAAESERARIQFSREQRKTVYLDFLNNEQTLHIEAYKLWGEMKTYTIDPSNSDQLDHQIDVYLKTFENTPRVVNAANLFASQPVYQVMIEWSKYDNDVQRQVSDLLKILDTSDSLPPDLVAHFGTTIEPYHQPSARHFETVAQADLGLTR